MLRIGWVPRFAPRLAPFAQPKLSVRFLSASPLRLDTRLPESSDPHRDLQSNDLSARLPKFPLHKDVAPSLIPKADSPRVNDHFSFRQLMETLRTQKTPELLYMAESHRLYFLACFALAFVAAYNLFDLLTLALPAAYSAYREDMEDSGREPMENLATVVKRFGLVAAMSAAYLFTSLFFVVFPSRLVRRIELDAPARMVKLVTHPVIPGQASPVISVPLKDLYIAQRAKVWTGDGFYGATSRSSFFFFLWESGRKLPWVVDRNGWFWGDARVYDVLFGKEPIAIAERGLSYDDGLKRQMLDAEKKRSELRRELGPAWQFKASTKLMLDDAHKFSEASKRAVLGTLGKSDAKQIGSENQKPESQQPESQKKHYGEK